MQFKFSPSHYLSIMKRESLSLQKLQQFRKQSRSRSPRARDHLLCPTPKKAARRKADSFTFNSRSIRIPVREQGGETPLNSEPTDNNSTQTVSFYPRQQRDDGLLLNMIANVRYLIDFQEQLEDKQEVVYRLNWEIEYQAEKNQQQEVKIYRIEAELQQLKRGAHDRRRIADILGKVYRLQRKYEKFLRQQISQFQLQFEANRISHCPQFHNDVFNHSFAKGCSGANKRGLRSSKGSGKSGIIANSDIQLQFSMFTESHNSPDSNPHSGRHLQTEPTLYPQKGEEKRPHNGSLVAKKSIFCEQSGPEKKKIKFIDSSESSSNEEASSETGHTFASRKIPSMPSYSGQRASRFNKAPISNDKSYLGEQSLPNIVIPPKLESLNPRNHSSFGQINPIIFELPDQSGLSSKQSSQVPSNIKRNREDLNFRDRIEIEEATDYDLPNARITNRKFIPQIQESKFNPSPQPGPEDESTGGEDIQSLMSQSLLGSRVRANPENLPSKQKDPSPSEESDLDLPAKSQIHLRSKNSSKKTEIDRDRNRRHPLLEESEVEEVDMTKKSSHLWIV